MYDEIDCELALPDREAPERTWFQTKSFPEPCLQRYSITKEGLLVDGWGTDLEPEGYVVFYTMESVGRAASLGRTGVWREFRARFSAGRLQAIERVAQGTCEHTYYGLASFRWFGTPSFLLDSSEDSPGGGFAPGG